MANSFLLGVNLAGAEFGSNVPGVFGTDYTYPTHGEIDYYSSKGMNVIRLPFLWERVQHNAYAALDGTELGRLDDVVNYATGKGMKIEIEPHNFGYGFGALIGSAQTPNSAFADFWGKLALHFKLNSNVMFGLMNEPHDQSASVWLGSANAAIAAIRSAGAVSQEILVPGSYWDGAWTWTSTDNDTVIGTGVQDPANNFAFEVHQYLDADGSGTHPGAVSATIGVERLTAITQWAEATGSRLFLGEVGVTTDATSLTALDGMLTYMLQHTGAWQGATYWAGGPWWGNYMFSIEPQNGVDKPQLAILVKHLGVTTYEGTSGPDYISVTGNLLKAFGNDGNDQLYFTGDQNQLFGGNGDDWVGINGNSNALSGGPGDDVWIGATGNSNTLDGGDANDKLYANGNNNYLFGSAGNDWLGVSGNSNQLFGGSGNAWMGATGHSNALAAGDDGSSLLSIGSNILFGGIGNDWVGCSGNSNWLLGGSGNDYLGATGNDNVLDGGAGNDQLVAGGAHSGDRFVFHPGYGMDTISNFSRHGAGGTDVVDLNGFGLNFSTLQNYLSFPSNGVAVITLDAATILTIANGIPPNGLLASDFIF